MLPLPLLSSRPAPMIESMLFYMETENMYCCETFYSFHKNTNKPLQFSVMLKYHTSNWIPRKLLSFTKKNIDKYHKINVGPPTLYFTKTAKFPSARLPSLISRISRTSWRAVASTAGLLTHWNSSHSSPNVIPSTNLSASDLSTEVTTTDEDESLPSDDASARTVKKIGQGYQGMHRPKITLENDKKRRKIIGNYPWDFPSTPLHSGNK